MANGQLDALVTQAKITNRLLAAQLKDQMPQNELILLLAGTGATHREIAEVLNTTAGTVGTTLTRLRKKGRLSGGQTGG